MSLKEHCEITETETDFKAFKNLILFQCLRITANDGKSILHKHITSVMFFQPNFRHTNESVSTQTALK